MREIVAVVAGVFGVSVGDILSDRRIRRMVVARQAAAVLIREVTGRSLPQIGADLGGRDHTTILHAIDVFPGKAERDSAVAAMAETARGLIGGAR